MSFGGLLNGGGFWTLPGTLHEILSTVGAHFCVKCFERACHSPLFFTVCFALWCDHHIYYSARLVGKSPVLRHLGGRPWEQEFLSVDEDLLGLEVAWQACELKVQDYGFG